jgi:aldose 1-epimerase
MIVLDNGFFRATLSAEHGAIVTGLEWTPAGDPGHRLLFSPDGARAGTAAPNRFGLWPMVPFANRAFGGIVDDGCQRLSLPINDPDMQATIHGFGWQSAWAVAEQSADRVAMVHSRSSTSDPYRYLARMTVALLDDHARLDLAVTNDAAQALPYGLGFHPWLDCPPDTVLTMRAGGTLAFAPGYRAIGLTAYDDGGPYRAGRAIAQPAELALSFVDWVGPALFAAPSRGLGIAITASETLRHPVLWTPPHSGFVCFEPQSHGIGAPSEAAARAITPLAMLEPGETLSGWMQIRPHRL